MGDAHPRVGSLAIRTDARVWGRGGKRFASREAGAGAATTGLVSYAAAAAAGSMQVLRGNAICGLG